MPHTLNTARRSVAPAIALLAAAGLALAPRIVTAQSIESDIPEGAEESARADEHYALPDVGDKVLASTAITDPKDRFSARFGLVVMPADYTTFSQDADSIRQVGEQDDKWEARSIRLMARGHLELGRRWNYVLSYEYKGFDKNSEANWSTTDVSLSTEFAGIGKLSFGKIKEPFAYEMVGDAANLPQNERLLNPFFVSRNVGVRLSNTMFDQRGTWAIGWYNDWWTKGDSFSRSGNDVAARVTALPLVSEDGSQYLHLAASMRYYAGDDDILRFKGKPGSNVASNYVDSGNLAADHAWNSGLEMLWANKGYSLLAEYMTSSVRAQGLGDPRFSGYYLTGSWVLSGETRPYDRQAGYARRVQPRSRWGALELIGRLGRVDLDDERVRGGTMDGYWIGVNWWATRRWKASIGYGDVDLEKGGITGNTRTTLSRIQWIY